MLRLDFSGAPRWIDLIEGVRVLADPFTSSTMVRARAILRRDAAAAPIETDEAIEAHFEAFTAAVAAIVITEWEGVGDVDGAPLPVSAAAVMGLMSIPGCSQAFKSHYMLQAMAVLDEKKGLAPLPDGTLAAGRLIVVPAARFVPPAPIA